MNIVSVVLLVGSIVINSICVGIDIERKDKGKDYILRILIVICFSTLLILDAI